MDAFLLITDALAQIDWLTAPVLFGISFGKSGGESQQSSSSTQSSGLGLSNKGMFERLLIDTGQRWDEVKDRPSALPLSLKELMGRAQSPFGFPALTANGLFPQQEEAFRNALMQAMGGASGDWASRGFLRPENINAIAGSAVQNVMPQWGPLIGQNVYNAALTPENVAQQRWQQLLQWLGVAQGFASGGQGTSVGSGSSNQSGFNFAISPNADGGGSGNKSGNKSTSGPGEG